ncbi:hypothetical protein C8J56DRAFT_958752 [Mycena floridula]|nr:hypothetical protein C8J56DRAFT_958752 [Mycena floridula]
MSTQVEDPKGIGDHGSSTDSPEPLRKVPYMAGMHLHMYPNFPTQISPRSKRRQVKNACTSCQRACKKCDDARPCLRCVKYGIPDECVNSQRKERKKGMKRGPYKKRDGKGSAAEQEVLPQHQENGSDPPPGSDDTLSAVGVPSYMSSVSYGPQSGFYSQPYSSPPLPKPGYFHQYYQVQQNGAIGHPVHPPDYYGATYLPPYNYPANGIASAHQSGYFRPCSARALRDEGRMG